MLAQQNILYIHPAQNYFHPAQNYYLHCTTHRRRFRTTPVVTLLAAHTTYSLFKDLPYMVDQWTNGGATCNYWIWST